MLWPDDSGQGLAESGLALGLIALICVLIVIVLGSNLGKMLTHVGTAL
jgi:Flp pilus assembly pilin Flp